MTQLLDRAAALQTLQPYSGLQERQFAPDDNYGLRVTNSGKVQYCFGDKDDTMPLSPAAWDTVFRASGLQSNSMIRVTTSSPWLTMPGGSGLAP